MTQDYKLGLRMLLKFPGLTIAGGLALALAIGVGAGWYDLSRDLFAPTIPLPDGDRVVLIQTQNTVTNTGESRIAHDFLEWRRELRTIEDIGAYHTLTRNLTVGDQIPLPIRSVELTAAAFRTARVAPILGRGLVDSDEAPGAAPVVILGYDLWQRTFNGRSTVVGSIVKLGDTAATVVGVMPEKFGYPVNQVAWTPLTLGNSYAALEGGPLAIIGRLAPGVTQEQADAEVRILSDRATTSLPATHKNLRSRVVPLGPVFDTATITQIALTDGPVLLVLLIACMNVGTLVYARTATREGEIALRSALGASRRRIVVQLFVEALVLASFAAALGLVAADQLLKWGVASVSARNGGPPFWMTPGLDVRTIVYAEGLAIVCAASISLLPALRATRTRIQFQLANLGTGGSTLRFGSVWTTAMIAQVALTVIAIPIAGESLGQMIRKDAMRAEFPSREYVSARIDLDRSFADEATSAFGERRARTFAELERRVRQEPGVVAVTMANDVPGGAPAVRVADVEPLPGDPSDYDDLFWTATVGPNFFDTLDRAIVTGRDFDGRDLAATARTVIVNEAFARRFDRQTHRGSPVGARLKYQARSIASSPAAEVEPWFEIVGVVRDVGLNPEDRGACCEEAPFIYHAASTGTIAPYVMTIRVRGNPAALTARLPALAAAISPGLRVEEAHALPQWIERRYQANRVMQSAQAGVTLLALFLSALGIYSLMSVSVTRRAREIGLRSALGAGPGDVLVGVIRRATVLMGRGVAVGAVVLLILAFAGGEEFTSMIGRWTAITSAVMLLTGILASLGPARRALRVNPTEALRES